MSLHFIYLYIMLPGLAYSFTIQKHCEYDASVGPDIDGVRRHYGVNHLHEPGRSLNYSTFRTVLSVEIFSRLAIFTWLLLVESITASAAPGVLPRKCKGMREYVRKPPPFPLARDTAGARECGAT